MKKKREGMKERKETEREVEREKGTQAGRARQGPNMDEIDVRERTCERERNGRKRDIECREQEERQPSDFVKHSRPLLRRTAHGIGRSLTACTLVYGLSPHSHTQHNSKKTKNRRQKKEDNPCLAPGQLWKVTLTVCQQLRFSSTAQTQVTVLWCFTRSLLLPATEEESIRFQTPSRLCDVVQRSERVV